MVFLYVLRVQDLLYLVFDRITTSALARPSKRSDSKVDFFVKLRNAIFAHDGDGEGGRLRRAENSPPSLLKLPHDCQHGAPLSLPLPSPVSLNLIIGVVVLMLLLGQV